VKWLAAEALIVATLPGEEDRAALPLSIEAPVTFSAVPPFFTVIFT
jgi:hypothetical protein